MNLDNNITQILLALIALFAAGAVITITFKSINKRKSKDTNLKNVKAGGDIVFGNKKTSVKK
ncbi:hypothetical protein [Flavobacterium inviolabile]|uniref:hypothetical protein n=1 Tax=Flavobacterium inviolabile TaxID=2748320 RepID=UPI0015AD0825|nr:hypothetical protein [Flavobacterium inviolabile]